MKKLYPPTVIFYIKYIYVNKDNIKSYDFTITLERIQRFLKISQVIYIQKHNNLLNLNIFSSYML